MLRDLFMAATGAASMLIVVALVVKMLKWREREGYRRAHENYYAAELSRDKYALGDDRDFD